MKRVEINRRNVRDWLGALSGWAALAGAIFAGIPVWKQVREAEKTSAFQALAILKPRLPIIYKERDYIARILETRKIVFFPGSPSDYDVWRTRLTAEGVKAALALCDEYLERDLYIAELARSDVLNARSSFREGVRVFAQLSRQALASPPKKDSVSQEEWASLLRGADRADRYLSDNATEYAGVLLQLTRDTLHQIDQYERTAIASR